METNKPVENNENFVQSANTKSNNHLILIILVAIIIVIFVASVVILLSQKNNTPQVSQNPNSISQTTSSSSLLGTTLQQYGNSSLLTGVTMSLAGQVSALTNNSISITYKNETKTLTYYSKTAFLRETAGTSAQTQTHIQSFKPGDVVLGDPVVITVAFIPGYQVTALSITVLPQKSYQSLHRSNY